MDYKEKIQENVQSLRNKIDSMQKTLEDTKNSLNTYLNENLESMCKELAKRNGYQATLSLKEKEMIDLVESGKFQKILELMPKSQKDSYRKATEKEYNKAKKKMPLDELVVCGLLDGKELSGSEEQSRLTLIMPVKFSDRDKIGSLEETLYGHHLNVDFQTEQEYNGYVQFALVVPGTQVEDTVKNLVSTLEQNLPSTLANANVKYGIIKLFDPNVPQLIVPEVIEVEKTKVQRPYTTKEATKIWREHCLAEGKDIPEHLINDKVLNFIRSDTKYIETTQDSKGNYQINPGSFLSFINSVTFNKNKSRWVPQFKETAHIPRSLPSQAKAEYIPLSQAANAMMRHQAKEDNVHIPYHNLYHIIRGIPRNQKVENKPDIKRTDSGEIVVEKNGFNDFINHYLVVPGKGGKKNYFLKKRPKEWNGITDLIGKELHVIQAANLLDVNVSYVYKRLQEGDIARSKPGYVTGDSLRGFIKTHEKKGSKDKTYWVERK